MAALQRGARRVKPSVRCPRFADGLIVAMYLWAVGNDRPQSWACDRTHYGRLFRPRKPLPSVSQFNRRIRTDSCQRLLQLVHVDLARAGLASPVNYLDGKPLPVSAVSKDPDARPGAGAVGCSRDTSCTRG